MSPRPGRWSRLLGLAFWFVWHVLDGADGDLARRTGRASPVGELVDGVCDHVSQGLIYVAFALLARRGLGGWAWMLALAAAASHFLQANAYETGRKAYRHGVHGAAWMRQTGSGGPGGLAGCSAASIWRSPALSPGEAAVEAAMDASAGRRRRRAPRRRGGSIARPSRRW